uniref:Uncharacterized protein n=1 Tax=Cucumis melo TaxID=3656 RepID=A0A9I9E6U1_CUCME
MDGERLILLRGCGSSKFPDSFRGPFEMVSQCITRAHQRSQGPLLSGKQEVRSWENETLQIQIR